MGRTENHYMVDVWLKKLDEADEHMTSWDLNTKGCGILPVPAPISPHSRSHPTAISTLCGIALIVKILLRSASGQRLGYLKILEE